MNKENEENYMYQIYPNYPDPPQQREAPNFEQISNILKEIYNEEDSVLVFNNAYIED